jgi:hypothetical protein
VQPGRYELGLDVADAVQRVRQGKPQSVLSAIHLARCRDSIAWIEWATPDNEFESVRVGWLVVERPAATTVGICYSLIPDGVIMSGLASIIRIMHGSVGPVVIRNHERPWLENMRAVLRKELTPERIREKLGSLADQIGLFVPALKAQYLLVELSRETVYRALATLECDGRIVRHDNLISLLGHNESAQCSSRSSKSPLATPLHKNSRANGQTLGRFSPTLRAARPGGVHRDRRAPACTTGDSPRQTALCFRQEESAPG